MKAKSPKRRSAPARALAGGLFRHKVEKDRKRAARNSHHPEPHH